MAPKVVDDAKLGGRLLVATPLLVGEEVARVPCGQVITFGELRERLARRFGADRCCALTTGICAAILAGAARDDIAAGKPARWPIWRLVRDDGSLNENWVLASRYRAALLRGEGLRVTCTKSGWRALDALAPTH